MKLSVLGLAAVVPLAVHAAEVKLGATTLTGMDITLLGLEFFGGIPYAEPPLGQRRLARPVLKPSLDVNTFNATGFGAACLQPGEPDSSEDCLTINVYRPAGTSQNKAELLPVMVFIHGGGFDAGSSAMYNASALVSRSVLRGTPIVFASLNYRLGPLGFPNGVEADRRGALNLGLRDQLVGLEWVQRNIEAFGGDPAKVTVFGESAGAIAIGTLFLNSGLERLVRGAIFESGSAGTTLTFDAAHRQASWDAFVQSIPECASFSSSALKSNSFACLRNASSESLLQGITTTLATANEEFPWVPTLDGPNGLLPDLPSRLWEQGKFAKVPFVTGTNLDEGTLFTPQTVSSASEIRDFIVSNFSVSAGAVVNKLELQAAATKLLELYPDNPALGSPFGTGNETFGLSGEYKRLAALNGDLSFQSLRRTWIQTAAKWGVKAYGYLFADEASVLVPSLGVQHALELLYVFGSLQLEGAMPPNTPSARTLMEEVQDYWLSFANGLDVNDGRGISRKEWPAYTSRNEMLIQLDGQGLQVIPDTYRKEQIGYIQAHPVLFRH